MNTIAHESYWYDQEKLVRFLMFIQSTYFAEYFQTICNCRPYNLCKSHPGYCDNQNNKKKHMHLRAIATHTQGMEDRKLALHRRILNKAEV